MTESLSERPRKRPRRCYTASSDDQLPNFETPTASRAGSHAIARYSMPMKSDQCLLKMQSANITPDDIKKLFPGVAYSDCTDNSRLGDELQGSNDLDVLQNLLDDLKLKHFPISVSTVEDLMSTVASSDSAQLIRNVEENCTKPVTDVLSKVEFVNDQLISSYKEIQIKLSEALMEDNRLSIGIMVLRHLSDYVTSALRSTCNDKTRDALVKFWNIILQLFQIDDQASCVTNRYRINGSGNKLLIQMNTNKQEDHRPLNNTPTNNISHLPKGHTAEGQDIVKVIIESKPDVIFERRQHIQCYGDYPVDLQHPEELTRCFIIQVEPRLQEFGCEQTVVSPTTCKHKHNSEGLEPPEYSTNTKNDTKHSRLELLRTKHLIELLSMLKSDDLEQNSLVHQINAVGLFVVMHRVCVTGLHVNSYRDTSGVTKKAYIDIDNCESYQNQKGKHFRMICSKWFNMLKAEHFKALMQFIQYLVCCHHKDLINLA